LLRDPVRPAEELEVGSLSDHIERHLLRLLDDAGGVLEIGRKELARRFECAPSQINYVLATRFTSERGYIIESRRGGGGYIRVTRVCLDVGSLPDVIRRHIGQSIDEERAHHCITRLAEEGLITPRETRALRAAIRRDVLRLNLPERDAVRASVLRAMILALLSER